MVAIGESGRRIGQDHPAAAISDHDVELMRAMHEEFPVGHPEHMGYRKLMVKFGLSKTQVRRICSYQHRAQFAVRFKRG